MSDDDCTQSKVQAVSHREAPSNIVDWLSQHETGSTNAPHSIAAKLYNACIERLANAWKRIQSNSAWSQSERYHLKESFGRFHLWGIGLPLDTLEDAETHIEETGELLLELLCNISELLTSDTLAALPRLLHDAEETSVLGQYTAAARNILANGNEEDESLTPVSAVVIKKSTAILSRTSWLDNFDFHLDCLQDLGSTIESSDSVNEPLSQHTAGATIAHTLPSTVSSLSGLELEKPHSSFVLQVRDKFPLSSEGLAERLGMANWQRFLRLRSENSRAEDTEFVRPAVPARSKFYDSALGSSLGAPSGSAGSVVSHLSFLSSQADEETLYFRVPANPLGVGQGKEFRCFICGRLQVLKDRIAWKIHVFADLMAYICSFEGCRRNKEPFSRRLDWADHELREHFTDRLWRCSFCNHSDTSADLYRDHLQRTHHFSSTDKKLPKRISGDVVTILKSVTEISCPLCRESGWNTHRSYFVHMGRHMEEIALTALAREVDDKDEASTEQSDWESDEPSPVRPTLKLKQLKPPNVLKEEPCRAPRAPRESVGPYKMPTPPPEDAKIGGKYQPWTRLTEWEMWKLRKEMKKNITWEPSDVMIQRELAGRGRGWESYCRAMAEAKANGAEFLDVDGLDQSRTKEDSARAGDPATGVIEVTAVRNRGINWNEVKKLKREILARERAEQAAQEAELAARRLGELGSSFKDLFNPLSSALANLQRQTSSPGTNNTKSTGKEDKKPPKKRKLVEQEDEAAGEEEQKSEEKESFGTKIKLGDGAPSSEPPDSAPLSVTTKPKGKPGRPTTEEIARREAEAAAEGRVYMPSVRKRNEPMKLHGHM